MLTVRSTINIASQTVPPIIPVVQGDTGRAILFTLADFTIPTGATATYYVQKPSGEAVYNNATIDGNNVLVNLTAQSIIEKGDNYGQVRIAVGEDIVTSFDFILLVKEFRGIDAVQSLTEMNIFDKAVEQAADAIDEVKTDALDDMDSAKTTALDDIGDAKEAALQEIEQTTGNFADDFSASATYAAGDYVMHSGQLYRFTANHAAGAWTGSDAEAVTVGEELTDLKAETTELKDDFDSITEKRGLDSIAFGNKTYRDIFEKNNLIPFGDFESGLGWISGNTNGAVISDDASYSRNHSLKCFGTSSVQIRKDIKSLSQIDIDIICKVKVDRYVSGGGAGFFYSDNKLINHVTDGWETVYQGRSTINANGTGSFFFGTVSAANCDAYIDDICVINLSGLWESSGNYPAQTKMKELYEEWIEIKNLQKKERNKKTYVGAVIDATDADARFKAMRQLLNIATAKSNDPGFDVPAIAYTYASKGTVIELPENPSMYEKINVDALFSANGDVQAIPASTTKVMTLITGIDFIDNINEVITITSSDIQTGSGNVFEAGDTCTIKDLMYTMLLPSSNTGARAFARVCGEKILAYRGITSPTDQEAYNTFITQMGIKATDIGMINSAFDSASGLSSSNKTTTNDMIHMMIEACSYPDICKIWGKNSYTFSVGGQNPRSITVDTTVTDAGIESEYVLLGGKTGHMYVDQSQACALVIVAKEK